MLRVNLRSVVARLVGSMLLAALGTGVANAAEPVLSQHGEELLAAMTVEEKVGQLTLLSSHHASTGPYATAGLSEAIRKGEVGGVFNVTDDLPSPPQDVVAFAANLCGVVPPPEISIDDANLTAMGRSFYDESKRVRNNLLRDELGVILAYPTYREGLKALHDAGEGPR